jgi:phage terminase large subunit-like protein
VSRLSRSDLERLTPDELTQFVATVEKVVQDRESGKVPWACDRPGCDGLPHPGRRGAHARAAQLPPPDLWDVWLILAGRGFGKTRTGAEWVIEQARTLERGALVGPTAADTRDILIEGESGIMSCAPATFRPVYEPSKRRLTYPNGSVQIAYSADEPDRLRGPQHHYGWLDELASWRRLQYAWDMLQLGMRLGDHPGICITTTPRPLPLIKALIKDPGTALVTGTTYENLHNLAPTFRRAVLSKYEGTTLGAQELHAVVLEDLPGALWKRAIIRHVPVEQTPEFRTVTVAMDPAGTGTGDETGLGVAARGVDGRDYVLLDDSERLSPNQACHRAFNLLERYGAKTIVVEDTGGKDWMEAGLESVWRDRGNKHIPLPVTRVNASQGKRLRAQPIAARYEQGRVDHVGDPADFALLEDQMCTWNPDESPDSPDRVDWLVHAITHHVKLFDHGEVSIASPHQRGGMRGASGTVHPLERARQARQARERARRGTA